MQVDPDEVARLEERLEAGEELDLNKVSAATNAAAKAAMDSRFNRFDCPARPPFAALALVQGTITPCRLSSQCRMPQPRFVPTGTD